jgi:uncharacterized protein YndB with AHSA1/START domain
MASIRHRISIDARPEQVQPLVATREGVERWWTGRPLDGDDAVGGRLSVYFGEHDHPSAVMEIAERAPGKVRWRCVDGPDDWLETEITFVLEPARDGGTTLLFTHAGWKHENEFMSGCSTNWCAYLTSLKSGVEGDGFAAYPAGEISRWG